MHAQTATQKSATFDQIYEKVPPDQVARLKEFRRTHPYKQLIVGGKTWEYISCGQGEETLLLLPGALSMGESVFPLISAFENEYRVIAPSYALSLTMTGLCAGLAHILERESLTPAHVVGGSYGGLVAQYFVRQCPHQTRSVILSHTFVFTPKLRKPLWIAGKVFPLLPKELFAFILRLRLNKILISPLRAAKHPESEFWRAYLDEAIASELLKEVFIHQNKALLELALQPRLTPDDLKRWTGRILIIESDNDPAITAHERALLRSTYPNAEIQTFSDAGHASSILKRAEVVSTIRNFIDTVVNRGPNL